jgi:NAD(P)-dependent dehydrogenase (short-subunit alcohol dehydrogenase family)
MTSSISKFVPLEDSGVLITGGTSGIGLASALKFAAAGVKRIGLIGRNVERGTRACEIVKQQYPMAKVVFISADANVAKDALRAAEQSKEQLGNIDILMNCTVGSFVPELFHDTPIENIIPMIIGQQIGPMHMCAAILPGMRERRHGCIINVASDGAKVVTPGEAVLGGAMAAIVIFSRTLSMEAKRYGVRVNALTPSLVEGTMMYEKVREQGKAANSAAFSARLFDKAAKMAMLGIAQPEDLANLAVFIAGPAGARLTGQTISLNGGISAG